MARRRIMPVAADAMVQMLVRGGALDTFEHALVRRIESDAPADLAIVGCGWDERTNTIRLAVESESFDDVPDGRFAPEWTPIFTSHYVSRYDAAMEVLGFEPRES